MGIFTAVAGTTGVYMPGLVVAPDATSVALTTLLQTGPLPTTVANPTYGNLSAAVAARSACIPLTLLAGAPTLSGANSAALIASAISGQSLAFAAGAAANNAGKWLLMIYA
jgi:hypothetical protein